MKDLETCRRYRRELDHVRALEKPSVRVLSDVPRDARAVAVLPGAFNPPTRAHLALARAAVDRVDVALFALGSVTIDKPEGGLVLEDRLYLLDELSGNEPRIGTAVTNRGLYAEQAEAVRSALPDVEDLVFVIGMDKLPQILDPRYYGDIESALATLFGRARLLVADREGYGREAFERCLDTPLARRFAERITWLPFDDRWRGISATSVRERLEGGDDASDALPLKVVEFLRETGAFSSRAEDRARYAERARRLAVMA